MNRFAPPGATIRALLVLIALAALIAPAIVVLVAPRRPIARVAPPIPARVLPADVLPPVEPVRLADLTPDEARRYNDGVPFVRGPNPPARSFVLRDGPDDLARATDCLAAAAVYEAGNDPAGQRAVVQVVLNRVRHPAFPKSVCGVVFEGEERQTGCQFTFTCDGALARWSPPSDLWTAARKVAAAALDGAVYRPVGYATHYHTDWVVPYWQASLDKIAAVHSHLFFRWTGWWGTPPAFGRRVDAAEPAVAKLAPFSDAHRLGGALGEADAATAEATVAAGLPAVMAGLAAQPVPGEDGVFLAALPPGKADLYPAIASAACGARPYCKYLGWTDGKALPASPALSPDQIQSMAFSYLRDRANGLERTLWNCAVFPRPQPTQCMRRQIPPGGPPLPGSRATTAPAAPSASVAVPVRVPDLDGVRRASSRPPSPQPDPSPTPRTP